jgi:hypothetical protein
MVDAEAKVIARVNEEVLDPLSDLADAMINVDAFCALLSDLHARDLPNVEKSHGVAIRMVRAGILRAAIGTVMACLDPPDPRGRGNRAGVGQILDTLKDPTLANFFATLGQGSTTAALQRARRAYEDLQKRDSYKRVKRLRDKAVGHILNTPAPEVEYEAIYELRDGAEQIITDLYAACGRRTRPSFLHYRAQTVGHSKVFWDTYFLGMGQL